MSPDPGPGHPPAVLAGALLLAVLAGTLGVLGGAAFLPSPSGEEIPMVTWGDMVEVDQGEAYQGPWRMNRSDFRYVDAPSVDLSDDGRMAVVWVDQARKDVLFQLHRRDGEPTTEGAPFRPNPKGEGGLRPWVLVGPLHRCYRIAFSDPPCPGPQDPFSMVPVLPKQPSNGG